MANRFVRLFQTMSCRDIQRLNVSASKNEVDSILASASHVNHGSKVRVQGWVKSVRSQKNVTFINLNDGSSQAGIQIIANPDAVDVSALSTGCSMAAEGKLSLSPGAKQSVELHADNIQLIGGVQQSYPLQKKATSLEFLRTQLHLRARTNTIGAVVRLRNTASSAIHQYFQSRDFIHLHTPILTSLDCEGAGEMFTVNSSSITSSESTPTAASTPSHSNQTPASQPHFFDTPAFLTVSGQLHAEMFACAMSKVYTFGPTFRAERSQTNRHLAEFWMVEPEIAFAGLPEILELSEGLLKHTIVTVLEQRADDIAFLTSQYDKELSNRLVSYSHSSSWARLTYTEAIKILEKSSAQFQFPVHWGISLQSEHEKYLAGVHCKGPVFVTDYPKEVKSFYMKLNKDGKTVACTDLLVPGMGELIGGSAREDDYEALLARMTHDGLDAGAYDWYLDLRRHGSVPHAGFGLGFERLVQCLSAMDNIRDVSLAPRTRGSCKL